MLSFENIFNLASVITITSLISNALTEASPWIVVSLAMVGKFMIGVSFAVIYVYAGEMMPTVVRSEAMGISSFFSGFGLLIFPYLNALVSLCLIQISKT